MKPDGAKGGFKGGVAFTPDGKRLLVSTGHLPTRVWDLDSKAVIGELSDKTPGWTAIATSADGKWAASGDDDGKILLWPLAWITE